MRESGYFVLAKFLDEEKSELEMTGFKVAVLESQTEPVVQVPTRHTVFTPAGVIHTNNYLR